VQNNSPISSSFNDTKSHKKCVKEQDYHFEEKFDLVIGNPPYFVIPKSSVDKKYMGYFEGRPNIYIIFM
jgi:tRNA1(Val) A37 N6-methylase TrmN6